ncbi:phosphatase PAP2 family protein [Halobacteria archaeon AArc-m2/3/4]|uniref:Phosphatase PAP2 family protein n=1 Tax=Natronoglomus mannanivorans TaxID=2979990 RepID=A0AAP3E4A3_9EURY|nr:phosphatase PAP2 family protein [Halobacteria archaeon AArc-xg1-1]MCU4975707.1 phosphatase PAP2 family protein [Halobacteria archaeon AArc-m2/3/4]
MSRGIGEFGPIQELLPEWAAILIALVTQLGDVWFLGLLVGLVYWLHAEKREDAAVILGFTIAGLALISALKHVFGLPRPDQPLVALETLPWMIQPLYEATAMASGYGFPSGHALMTTIVYFGLAHRLSISTPRRRFGIAGLVIAAVCFSRVALGVHYLVDVVAGVSVGIVFLLGAERLLTRYSSDQGTVAFTLAVGLSAINLAVGGVDSDGILLLGAALGTFGGWQLIVLGQRLFAIDRPSEATRPLVVRGALAGAALGPLVLSLEAFSLFSIAARGGAVGLALGVFITIPVLRHSKHASRLWTALVFWSTMAALGLRFLLSPRTWRRALELGRRYSGELRRRLRTE